MTEFVVAYARDKDRGALFGEGAYADKWQYLLNRPESRRHWSFPADAVECSLPEGRYEAGSYGEGELSVALLDPVMSAKDNRQRFPPGGPVQVEPAED